jgi:hypothetical protein
LQAAQPRRAPSPTYPSTHSCQPDRRRTARKPAFAPAVPRHLWPPAPERPSTRRRCSSDSPLSLRLPAPAFGFSPFHGFPQMMVCYSQLTKRGRRRGVASPPPG